MQDDTMATADCLIGFSNPKPEGSIGSVNEMLSMSILAAVCVGEYARQTPFLFLQKDLSVFVNDPARIAVIDNGSERKRLSVYAVAREASRVMKCKGWNQCVVVAPRYCLFRCRKVVEKLQIGVVGTITTGLYDAQSTRFWVRGPIRCFFSELVLSIVYKIRGWI